MPYFFTSVRTDCSGHPTLIGMGIDISARKEAEDEVKAFNRDLELRVTRRTAALEAANQELEAFAYSVSHDLRAPLRHINAFAHILQRSIESKIDESDKSNLEAIVVAAQRMDQLINDLLSLSRAGRQEMRLTSVDLNKLVELVRSELAPEMMERNIEWQVAPLPSVKADASLLRQVFLNLLANAIKYTRPREKARIEIGAEQKEHEYVIFVRDNGVGFDPKYVHRLFGVFQRLHTDREFEGTGIGLAIVRRIITRHGGAAWAEGRANDGATFYFTLPKKVERERH
jgi:light-regulated signal transduction histidine kinase (bacteriophytochrome)